MNPCPHTNKTGLSCCINWNMLYVKLYFNKCCHYPMLNTKYRHVVCYSALSPVDMLLMGCLLGIVMRCTWSDIKITEKQRDKCWISTSEDQKKAWIMLIRQSTWLEQLAPALTHFSINKGRRKNANYSRFLGSKDTFHTEYNPTFPTYCASGPMCSSKTKNWFQIQPRLGLWCTSVSPLASLVWFLDGTLAGTWWLAP